MNITYNIYLDTNHTHYQLSNKLLFLLNEEEDIGGGGGEDADDYGPVHCEIAAGGQRGHTAKLPDEKLILLQKVRSINP